MAFLRDMSARFWNYISPRKTQQRREKPFKVPAPPVNKGKASLKVKGTKEMSPDTLVRRWNVQTPVSRASFDQTQLPPSPPRSSQRSYTDFEGDTLIVDFMEQVDQDEGEWDANEETIVVDEGRYMEVQKKIDPEAERLRREDQGRDLRAAGWSSDAIFLFQKLGMRGFEPLFPIAWIDDFESLPAMLFTANLDKAFIKPCFEYPKADFHAQKALVDLFTLGGRARDAVLTRAPRRTPEYHINKAVNQYNRWAMKDSELNNIWNDLSIFEAIHCSKDDDARIIEQKMIRKLNGLADLWQKALNINQSGGSLDLFSQDLTPIPEIPTLYGIIASHTVMFFVSYVPPAEPDQAPALRTVANFDFGMEGYDVWNSLAIAIFVIHCRNRMMELKEYLPEGQPSMESDPDL